MKNSALCLLPFTMLLSFSTLAQARWARATGPLQQATRQLTRLQAASRGTSEAAMGRPATTLRLPGQTIESNWATAGGWENQLKQLNSYTSFGKPSQIVITDSVSGDTLGRTVYTYATAIPGYPPTLVLTQNWNGTWEDAERDVFTYDTRQQLSEQRTELFDGTNWNIQEGTRYRNGYNNANQLMVQVVEQYNATAMAFVNEARYLYQVQPSGAWTQVTTQAWRNGAWADSIRLTSVVWHDFAKKQLLLAQRQAPDASGQWTTTARLTGTYRPALNTLLTEGWDGTRFFNMQREVSRFDALGHNVEEAIESWDDQTATWELMVGIRNQLTFDAAGDIATRVMQLFFPFGTSYENFLRYSYSNYQAITLAARLHLLPSEALQAYPNPSADGRFTLQTRLPAGPVVLRVTDALGREVLHQNFAKGLNDSAALDLSQQPAGLYTLELRTAGSLARQKLAVK